MMQIKNWIKLDTLIKVLINKRKQRNGSSKGTHSAID
jgi:hypothetical protein